jgi:hypothetical protein
MAGPLSATRSGHSIHFVSVGMPPWGYVRSANDYSITRSGSLSCLKLACVMIGGRFEAFGYILTKTLPIIGGKQAIGLLLASGGGCSPVGLF